MNIGSWRERFWSCPGPLPPEVGKNGFSGRYEPVEISPGDGLGRVGNLEKNGQDISSRVLKLEDDKIPSNEVEALPAFQCPCHSTTDFRGQHGLKISDGGSGLEDVQLVASTGRGRGGFLRKGERFSGLRFGPDLCLMELVRQIRNFSLLIRQNTNGKKKQNKDRSNRDFSFAQAQKLPLVWSE